MTVTLFWDRSFQSRFGSSARLRVWRVMVHARAAFADRGSLKTNIFLRVFRRKYYSDLDIDTSTKGLQTASQKNWKKATCNVYFTNRPESIPGGFVVAKAYLKTGCSSMYKHRIYRSAVISYYFGTDVQNGLVIFINLQK